MIIDPLYESLRVYFALPEADEETGFRTLLRWRVW